MRLALLLCFAGAAMAQYFPPGGGGGAATSIDAGGATSVTNGTNGDVLTIAAGKVSHAAPGACATCVTSAASLTSTAIMTGAGSQGSQTPAATATLDTSGNISTPGSISTGVGGSVAGTLELVQGSAPSLGTTSVKFYAPASVTSYAFVLPGSSATGFLLGTNSSNVNTMSFVGSTGSGNVVRATSPALTTPDLGTPSAATLTNATGLPISSGVSGLGTGVATFLGTPSSANLAAALTNETGSGAAVFGTGPTLSGLTLSDVATGTQCLHANSSGVVSGTGSDCGSGGGSGITIGTTTITSGTNTKVLFDNSGVVGEYTITGTTNVVMSGSPTITTPIIAQINDTNGNAYLKSVATASAVDQLTITNAATANPAAVDISGTGTDSNIGFTFTPKGTGTIVLKPASASASPYFGILTPGASSWELYYKQHALNVPVGTINTRDSNGGIDFGNVKSEMGYQNGNGLRLASDLGFKVSSTTDADGTADIGVDRDAAGILGVMNGTVGTTAANYRAVKASAYYSGGTAFTTDTGCGTNTSLTGGATAGKFTLGTGGSACTVVVTMGNSATAPNGWSCTASDQTTAAGNQIYTITSSTTTASLRVPAGAVTSDVINFSCHGY